MWDEASITQAAERIVIVITNTESVDCKTRFEREDIDFSTGFGNPSNAIY